MKLITLQEFLMGRDHAYPKDYTEQIAQNAAHTVEKINQFLERTGFDGHVNSGWRPPSLNAATKGAAPHSKHMLGLACDLADPHEELDKFCTTHAEILESLDLWRESPLKTVGWIHLQVVPYGSWVAGKSRTFMP